jgi:hypothetical protein
MNAPQNRLAQDEGGRAAIPFRGDGAHRQDDRGGPGWARFFQVWATASAATGVGRGSTSAGRRPPP